MDDAQGALYRKRARTQRGPRRNRIWPGLLEAGRGQSALPTSQGDAPRVSEAGRSTLSKDIDPTCSDFDYPNKIFDLLYLKSSLNILRLCQK